MLMIKLLTKPCACAPLVRQRNQQSLCFTHVRYVVSIVVCHTCAAFVPGACYAGFFLIAVPMMLCKGLGTSHSSPFASNLTSDVTAGT